MPKDRENLDPVWKALSDPTRRRLLDLLNIEAMTTSELAQHFDLSRFAVMKHLTVLEEAGLISVTRRGRKRWNRLNPEPLANIYSRWLSRQSAWVPTLEGQRAQDQGPIRLDEPEPEDDEDSSDDLPQPSELREILLIVRPEEKYAVERALQSVLPPVYASFHVLGRGGAGQNEGKRGWRRPKQLAALLPKIAFTFVTPEEYVNPVIRAVSAVLRSEGGPADLGTGFAVVSRLDEEIVIGSSRKMSDPNKRVLAEGWAEETVR